MEKNHSPHQNNYGCCMIVLFGILIMIAIVVPALGIMVQCGENFEPIENQ
jgi:hypothetical protein